MRFAACLTALLIAATRVHAASFDCTKARAPDETAVCGSAKLSELDTLVGQAYASAQTESDAADKTKVLADARRFDFRKRACQAKTACLMSAYVGVLQDFQALGSKVDVPKWIDASDMTSALPAESRGLPLREGDCVQTRVSAIGARLEGDPDFSSGISVDFANGGHQVSYDKEPGIASSRHGDGALMCLTSIPKHCPPNDDRGRMYTTTNLRTHKTWSLPDSQHSCGGA